ncbi:Rieske 2Fe-2S domain-containing protein [Govanella unica]|uniref:Rieske 2Fe-2S domain-containing protein n=1 Tax=Govanella unica TaxID=2975056 RepID=A0A9X3U0D6_9PROT|nr:Rieske 2Fe-2S domain-containing protein [Govania unica]MDA5195040.1 Rieske 2Fe-2S domain-containing protein [Govania unica]
MTQVSNSPPVVNHIPAEGENGLFSQSWFPICTAAEVAPGQIIGRSFLDGRVVILRGESGEVQVLSPYCPHLGTDLVTGEVDGDIVRCAFHKWEFDLTGQCVRTAIGDPAPKAARLFRFPTVERFGLIWAFNGTEPTWELPSFPFPDEELSVRARYDVPVMPVDPWVVCANTPDWQHLRAVHRMDFDTDRILTGVRWTEHSMEYDIVGRMEHGSGDEVNFVGSIYGTSLFRLYGTMGKQWFGVLSPFGMPRPGVTQNYFITCFKKSDNPTGNDADFDMAHLRLFEFGKHFTSDDRPILHNIRYRPGTLTKSDRLLARYLNMVRNYPRAHPSSDYIK